MLGPVQEGERIRLVPPVPAQVPAFVGWFADPHVTHFLMVRFPLSVRQEEDWLERMAASQEDIVWSICATQTGEHIGATGLSRIDWRHRHAWNGIVIGERGEWGKGYATEAIRLTTRFAFRELGLAKVLTSVYAGNHASRRVMEKVGFTGCGLLRRQRFFDGGWHDEWLGEILGDEWKDV